MIYLILSLIIVYPENNEGIEKFFVVLSDVGDTTGIKILLDEEEIFGEIQFSESTFVFFPEEPSYGSHILKVHTISDTVSSSFFFRKYKEGLSLKRNSIYELGFFVNHISTNPENPLIEGYGGLSGYYTRWNYKIYLNTSDLYSKNQPKSQIKFTISYPLLNLTIGDHYPDISRIAYSQQKLTGVSISTFNLIGFVYGDMTQRRESSTNITPKSSLLGIVLGSQNKLKNYIRFIVIRGRQFNPYNSPYDNAVFGFNLGGHISSYSIDGGVFGSVYTRNRNIVDSINDIKIKLSSDIFTLNSSTISFYPTTKVLSYYLDIYTQRGRISFTRFGESFYNRMSYGVVQGLWKLDFSYNLQFGELILGFNDVISKIQDELGIRINTNVSVPHNMFNHNLNYTGTFTHSFGWVFNGFINTSSYLYLGNYNRLTLNLLYPQIIYPSLKIEFTKRSKPYYEIGISKGFKYIDIIPKISYYSGSVAGMLTLRVKFERLNLYLYSQYSSKNYRFFISSSYRDEAPF